MQPSAMQARCLGCALPLITLFSVFAPKLQAELRIPASTAYLDPRVEGARITRSGLTGWRDTGLRVLWFGQINTTGVLDCAVALRARDQAPCHFRLSVAGHSREISVRGQGTNVVLGRFGSFPVSKTGYHRFSLEYTAPPAAAEPVIDSLLLDGPAAGKAHFNLKPRRNAASVHLWYPLPAGTQPELFYCEMIGLEDPPWTYYMACGWHRGYFGMQVNSPTERRIIFSVWDSGSEAVDRAKVAQPDRVTLVGKSEGVVAGDFGNEGTGGHSHWVYPWKTGEQQRFVVTAKPVDPTHTVYSGYYFHPDRQQWKLISSWKAPREGGYLRGLYSFSENFGGANGHLQRKALYGNQWIRTPKGEWIELTSATFSYDNTGRTDRLDRFMGLENGRFFLSHGGFIDGQTSSGEKFARPAVGQHPADLVLPELLPGK